MMKTLERANVEHDKLVADVAKLREALSVIADTEPKMDMLHTDANWYRAQARGAIEETE